MSMGLSVWCSEDIKLPSVLPNSGEWKSYGGEWAYERERWQILVAKGDEKPEEEIKKKLPGAYKVVYVTLEPIGADREGYKLLETVVRTLAKSCGGVWVDPNGTAYLYNEGQF